MPLHSMIVAMDTARKITVEVPLRSGMSKLVAIAALAGVSLFLILPPAVAQTGAPALNLIISPKQPFVAEPEAARIVLHIHNAGARTVWLYRRARGNHPVQELPREENRPIPTTGGSTVEVLIQPADAKAAQAATSPAQATVLEYVQMPKPRLVRVPAGGDYEETSIVQLEPAQAEGQKPIWGAYRVSVAYAASFSNADIFERSLGADLWQGELKSNTITVELRPPLPDSVGTVSGSAVAQDLQPRAGVRVSLSDEQGLLIAQQITAGDGRFLFEHLPVTLYWVSGRREGAQDDTLTFRHAELSSASPKADVQLVFYPPDAPDAKKMVHKPVLLKVLNPGGQPLGGIDIDAVFSNGDVLDDLKAATGDDGTVVMELLPGRNSVSLKKRGCGEQTEPAEVAPGVGVDGFKFTFDCVKK